MSCNAIRNNGGAPRARIARSIFWKELSALIGWPAIEVMMDGYDGETTIYVPKSYADDARLVRVVGCEVAKKLIATYPGESIRTFANKARLAKFEGGLSLDAAICRQDRSATDIARDFGQTAMWVMIRAKELRVKLPAKPRYAPGPRAGRTETAAEMLLSNKNAVVAAGIETARSEGATTYAEIAEVLQAPRWRVEQVGALMARAAREEGTSPDKLLTQPRNSFIASTIEAARANGTIGLAEVAEAAGVLKAEIVTVALLMEAARRDVTMDASGQANG